MSLNRLFVIWFYQLLKDSLITPPSNVVSLCPYESSVTIKKNPVYGDNFKTSIYEKLI